MCFVVYTRKRNEKKKKKKKNNMNRNPQLYFTYS